MFDNSGNVEPEESKNTKLLLSTIFGNSPYLTSCVFREAKFFISLVSRGFEVSYQEIIEDTRGLYDGIESGKTFADLSCNLRLLRRKASMLLALAEITGAWDIQRAAKAQTEFAETVLDISIKYLLLTLSKEGDIDLADARNPARDSGLIVLGLGKLGGR